jgi:hypothetical protein
MSIETDRSRLTVAEFSGRFRGSMIPLTNSFSYFSLVPIAEEDLKHYLHDPVSALPPAVCASLPKIGMALVPYLEKPNGKGSESVTYEKPAPSRQMFSAHSIQDDMALLFFGIKDEAVADYHYAFYGEIASLISFNWPEEVQDRFFRLIREELSSEVHGEVDERSWHLKQALLRRQINVHRESKLFRDYARQAFEDTLTLYLHGICCDIDVETGPRQLPSRYLRKRLDLLLQIYPPPEGYAVFPDQLKRR